MKKQIILLALLMTQVVLYAGTTSVVREHTFRAGAQDSEITAREQALRQMKLEWLQEDIGMLMQSFTQVRGSEQGREITRSFSQRMEAHAIGVVRARIIDSRWDGQTFWVRAELSADMERIQNDLDALRREMQAELLAYTRASRQPSIVEPIAEPRLTANRFRVYENGILLLPEDVRRLMSDNNQALNLYNRGMSRSRETIAIICVSAVGLGGLFYIIGVSTSDSPREREMREARRVKTAGLVVMGIGAVVGAIAIPITTIQERRYVQHAVDMFNRGLHDVRAKKPSVELQFGVTQNGLGFVLNF